MFFQEAGTPTCSQQVATVDAEHELLDQLGARAVCLSTDPPERQVEFAAALGGSRLPLASDPDGRIASAFGVFDPAEKRARRAAFVVSGEGAIVLAIPWYNPANSDQLVSIFGALGMEDDTDG
jgi:peroxiredoxin